MPDFPTTQNTPRPGRHGYGVALSGELFRLVPTPSNPVDIQLAERTPQRIQENPEDFAEGYAQSFSRVDFRGGAGLPRAHRKRSDDVGDRYWDSYGTRVLQDKGHVTLAHQVASIDTATGTAKLLVLDGALFYADSSSPDVQRATDPLAAVPVSWATETTGATGNLTDITSVGGEILAISADGIFLRNAAGTWSNPNTFVPTAIWGVKGRLLLAQDNDLYELSSPYTDTPTTPIISLPPGDTWLDVVDTGTQVVAAGSGGILYFLSEDVSSSLAIVVDSRFDLPGNEVPTALGFLAGILLVGTAEPSDAGTIGRLWATDSSTALGSLQVVRSWGDIDSVPGVPASADHSPVDITVLRESALVALRDSVFDEAAVFRFDATTGGVHRELSVADTIDPVSIVQVDGRAMVATSDGEVYREELTFVPNGWVTSPLADFFSARNKLWSTAALTANVDASTEVDLYVSVNEEVLEHQPTSPTNHHQSWILGARGSMQVTVEEALSAISGRSMAFQARLYTLDSSVTPTYLAGVVRAYPPIDDVIISLPISVSDQVEQPGRRRFRVKGWGNRIYDVLRNLETQIVTAQMLVPPYERIRGLVESVSSPVNEYGKEGASLSIATVRIRGRRVQVGSVTSGVTYGSLLYGEGAYGGTYD